MNHSGVHGLRKPGDDLTVLSSALTRTEEAEAAAADLKTRLSAAREAFLDFERRGGQGDATRQIGDRAEDLRRELVGPLSGITVSIRAALHTTEAAYFSGAVSGEVDVAHARTMIGVVLQSAREVRHLQLAIKDTADAMGDLAIAPSESLRTPRTLPRALQRASTSLEQAQRGAFRANEDLVIITRSLAVDVAGLLGDRVEAGAELPPDLGPAGLVEPVKRAAVNLKRFPHDLAADRAELFEIASLARRHDSNLLVVDRAEDLRRSLRDQRRGQLQGIRDALHEAETLLLERATARDIELGAARSMTSFALQAAKELRFLQLDLGSVADSLKPLAQSSPNAELTEKASNGVAAATTVLDRGCRSAFQVCSDLPVLTRAIAPQCERPVALSLVISEEVELPTLARDGQPLTHAGIPVQPNSHVARPIGLDR